MDVDMEGVPHAALPGAHRAGPSSDTSEDGWECDGWRHELGDSEVAEAYMDAKFGGEGADMVEIAGEGGTEGCAALLCSWLLLLLFSCSLCLFASASALALDSIRASGDYTVKGT